MDTVKALEVYAQGLHEAGKKVQAALEAMIDASSAVHAEATERALCNTTVEAERIRVVAVKLHEVKDEIDEILNGPID